MEKLIFYESNLFARKDYQIVFKPCDLYFFIDEQARNRS
ncbi:hypothetical protein LEP1GSC125_1445 [Leptospira mayottensis 200901122]|uniref:Uncharacterized protein n=1 Tax=Leptospira mayottensis 200901122 TaxID=1193010 RepID=A0AA87MQU4_9LEPT|nr:hypothetical protein LEP1GSC125_1445 [Leptospira mayottensis 200901122]